MYHLVQQQHTMQSSNSLCVMLLVPSCSCTMEVTELHCSCFSAWSPCVSKLQPNTLADSLAAGAGAGSAAVLPQQQSLQEQQ
jgi:hypothetical protein